jgi:hypothetical protein
MNALNWFLYSWKIEKQFTIVWSTIKLRTKKRKNIFFKKWNRKVLYSPERKIKIFKLYRNQEDKFKGTMNNQSLGLPEMTKLPELIKR